MQKTLLIVGDSYCRFREEETDWPVVLSRLLDSKLEGKGFAGQSFWHQRRWMLQNLEKLKLSATVVICHTDPARMPCVADFSVTPKLIDMKSDDAVKSISNLRKPSKFESKHFEKLHQLIVDFYKSELFVFDFYEYAWKMWIVELAELTSHARVFHLAFNDHVLNELKKINKLHGTILTPALYKLSLNENSQWTGNVPDSRRNHLSDKNNVVLANELFSIINDNADPVIDLNKFS